MPTRVFLNLKEEKKSKIIDAIKKEVSSYPYEEIQVKRIIEDASIARGSFYQYFDNIEDMFVYILKMKQLEIADVQQTLLEQNPNDIYVKVKENFKQRIKNSYNQAKDEMDYKLIEQIRKSPRAIELFLQSMGLNESERVVKVLLFNHKLLNDFNIEMIRDTLIPSLKLTIEKLFKASITLEEAMNEIDAKFDIIDSYIKKIENN